MTDETTPTTVSTSTPTTSDTKSKIKKALLWVFGILAAVIGCLLLRPKKVPLGGVIAQPIRPTLGSVDVTGVGTSPSTDYDKNKVNPSSDPTTVIGGLNQRYGDGSGGDGSGTGGAQT